jgi:hypothetical protein
MASFNTHFTVGLATSGLVASSALITGTIGLGEAFIYFGLGAIGSLLPDLDADNSVPTRIGAGLLSIALAFTAVFIIAKHKLSLIELIGVWIGTFLFFRYIVFYLATHLTVHRGLFHSIPAGVLLGLITTATSFHLIQQSSHRAWLAGIFVTGGYIVHLLLDEIYSIDWSGKRVKRSFGSAFKFWSKNNWIGTVLLYIVCIGLYFINPSPRSFLNAISYFSNKLYLQQVISNFYGGNNL